MRKRRESLRNSELFNMTTCADIEEKKSNTKSMHTSLVPLQHFGSKGSGVKRSTFLNNNIARIQLIRTRECSKGRPRKVLKELDVSNTFTNTPLDLKIKFPFLAAIPGNFYK